jgi:ubiquinone/menaquinone biosynthesis C-methylase UbiE
MLDLANLRPGHSVLDIAAGDGDQSMMAAHRVGSSGRVLATDISSNLLSYAAAAAQEAGLENLETRVMDGEALDLDDESFDAVISRLGLMLIPNVNRAMSEIYRVLKNGGRVSAVLFSTPDKSPWLSIPAQVARKHAKLPLPQPGTPGLFGLSMPGYFAEILSQAGFQDIEAYPIKAPMSLASAAECVQMLKDNAGGIHTILATLNSAQQEAVWIEIEIALRQFEGEGGFESPSEVIVSAATKAH